MWRVGADEASFAQVPVADYAVQAALAWALWALGHALWAWRGHRLARATGRGELAALAVLAALVWAPWAVGAFPVSLTLPAVVAASIWGLRRRGAPSLAEAPPAAPRTGPLWATAALPVAAVGTFAAAQAAGLSWPVNLAVLLGCGLPAAWAWGRAVLGRPAI